MSCYVYIAECQDNSYYAGITWNVRKRIIEHNSGIKTPIQKSRRPVKLVYWQKFPTRREAAKKEKEIKG